MGVNQESNCCRRPGSSSYWPTYRIQIYMSGPIETAKQVLRKECLREGLCVTIDPTTFIYAGGEESGFVIGLLNYPRFPKSNEELRSRAGDIALLLLDATCQLSALIVTPEATTWISNRISVNETALTNKSTTYPYFQASAGSTSRSTVQGSGA